MEFLCLHRDRDGSAALREELGEAHQAYMDRFAAGMVARGPTLDAAREAATGSLHIVDLPDVAAARAFALDEPNQQAGVYRDVMVRRWRNALGRTMWEVPGGPRPGWLVLGLGPRTFTVRPPAGDGLMACGTLLSDDGRRTLGTAALVDAADEGTARALLRSELYSHIEVHPWQPGGRG